MLYPASSIGLALSALLLLPPTLLASAAESMSNTTLYFGYGSNLWQHQMEQRCPTSKYLGVARLNDYRWIINSRGYANVVEIQEELTMQDSAAASGKKYMNEVWGLVYSLEEADEKRLDRNEGVPVAYTKEVLEVDFWDKMSGKKRPEKSRQLVYINRNLTEPDEPMEEYVYRMNMGIKDALKEGVPKGYVDAVMRRFIPVVEDERVEVVARRQALEFEDER